MNRYLKLILFTILFLPFISKGETSIVPELLHNDNDYSLACQFLEHYVQLLRAPKSQAVSYSIVRIKDDGFKYIVGNNNKMLNLKGTEDFSIALNNNRYVAQWSSNGTPIVSCTFPANIFLLTSSNKIDLENRMIEQLKKAAFQSDTIPLPKSAKNSLNKVSLSNFYIADNGFYITPRLKNQLVFEIDAIETDSCRLLMDPDKYQLESFANMMLTGYSTYPQVVKTKVIQYGYKQETVEIPLVNLFNLFTEEGCNPYWGIDVFDGKNIKGVYLWINPFGGYAHMLTVDSSIDAINNPTTHIAKLHCYLRLDNLKTLFEEYN